MYYKDYGFGDQWKKIIEKWLKNLQLECIEKYIWTAKLKYA